MIESALLAGGLLLIWLLQMKYRLADDGPRLSRAGAGSADYPALRFRGRCAWCEVADSHEGYGASAVAVVNCGSSPAHNSLAFRSALRQSCFDLQLQHGGERGCPWACLGEGDCALVCPQAALAMVDRQPVVDAGLCIGCGACVAACPRQVISLIPADAQLYVACASADTTARRTVICDSGCADSGACLENSFLEPGLVASWQGRRLLNYTRSANLLPLRALCAASVFRDRIDHRPWFTVNRHCTGCGDCLPACPAAGCILPEGEAMENAVGRERVRIVPELCVGCGLCLPRCPEKAIQVVGAVGYDLKELR